jgi:hypothetical protein
LERRKTFNPTKIDIAAFKRNAMDVIQLKINAKI